MKTNNSGKDNIIEFKNITKTFLGGKIVANKDVTFAIKQGSIHAIAGENGAGKSTLLSMLFGLYQPTAGEIFVRGKKVEYKNAADAMNDGLGMVQQHFQLVDKFTVAENVTLGIEEDFVKEVKMKDGKKSFKLDSGILNSKKTNERIDELAKTYGFNVSAKQKVSELTVGQEQKVEILKLLYRNSEILIFDEPTAMLTPKEIDELIEIILDLKKKGNTIIIITHKLDEIKRMADEVTVIRRGEYIGTKPIEEITPEVLSKMMVGADIIPPVKEKVEVGETVLKVENLFVEEKRVQKLKGVSFEVKKGEIVAISGVEGNGQVQLANIIAGLQKQTSGDVLIRHNVAKGKASDDFQLATISTDSIKKRNKYISHIPENRHKYGMILDLKCYENAQIKEIDKYSFMGYILKSKMKDDAKVVLERFDVRGTNDGEAVSRGLSGGNQQKLVVGREVSAPSELLIVFQATRGLDVGAINFIHKQILLARKYGKAILLISYDLNEIITLADRVLVINSGAITGEVIGKDINKSKIGELMAKTVTVANVAAQKQVSQKWTDKFAGKLKFGRGKNV